jgi:serine/threonine-protein kinase
VEHPNVCKVYEVGELDGQPYIAMQLVLGSTLSQVGQALLLRDKVETMRDVADAVHVAHRQGLIHLDLKPGNILMEPKESGGFRPLVTDFGLYMREGAQVGELFQQRWLPLGTPPYSSPEQLSASWEELDRRSDVYSMGVVLHWLLSGRTP